MWIARQTVFFQFSDENIGVTWRHSGAHRCTAFLQKVFTIKSNYIVFKYKSDKLTDIFAINQEVVNSVLLSRFLQALILSL